MINQGDNDNIDILTRVPGISRELSESLSLRALCERAMYLCYHGYRLKAESQAHYMGNIMNIDADCTEHLH